MNIFIRQGTLKDAALLADLSRETFSETFAGQNAQYDMQLFMDTQFTREALMQEPTLPGNQFFLAYADGEVAGYVRLLEGSPPTGLQHLDTLEIARIYVRHRWIGYGVGKALMEKSLQTAKKKGKQVLWLGVWEKNTAAIAFYTKWGFEKFGSHPFLLGTDVQTDWLMKREVGGRS